MNQRQVMRGVPEIEAVLKVIETHTPNRAWVAGGYAAYCAHPRHEPPVPGDVDVFAADCEAFDLLRRRFAQESLSVNDSERAVTFEMVDCEKPVQLVKPRNQVWTSQTLLEDFDFVVCRAVLLSRDCVMVDADFYTDAMHLLLRIKRINNPMGTLMRIVKYVQKGYTVFPHQFAQVLEAFHCADAEKRQALIDEFKYLDGEVWETIEGDEPFIDDEWDRYYD